IVGIRRFGLLDARTLRRQLRPAETEQGAVRERPFDAHAAEYRLGGAALLGLQELPAEREVGAVAQRQFFAGDRPYRADAIEHRLTLHGAAVVEQGDAEVVAREQ